MYADDEIEDETGDDTELEGSEDAPQKKVEAKADEKGNEAKEGEKDEGLAADVARLKREKTQTQKNLDAVQEKLNAANAKLTKLGVTDEDDPADLKAELEASRKEIAQNRIEQREAQKLAAVSDYLSDRFPKYLQSADYIAAKLRLSEDDLVDGKLYDADILKAEAERECKTFIKRNPRPLTSQADKDDEEDEATGAEGSPSRNGHARPVAKSKTAKLTKMNEDYGGFFSKKMGLNL